MESSWTFRRVFLYKSLKQTVEISKKFIYSPAPEFCWLKLVLDPPVPNAAIVPNDPPRCCWKLVFWFWNPPCEPPAFKNGTPKPPNCPFIEVKWSKIMANRQVNLHENMITNEPGRRLFSSIDNFSMNYSSELDSFDFVLIEHWCQQKNGKREAKI